MARANKHLREMRALTFISAVFVAAGCWAVTTGAVVLGVAAIVFFSAGLLFGIMFWREEVKERRAAKSGDTSSDGTSSEDKASEDKASEDKASEDKASDDKAEVVVFAIAAALLGLGCLSVVVLALVGWADVGAAVAMQLPRILVLVAGAVGAVFFLGGAVVILVRGLR